MTHEPFNFTPAPAKYPPKEQDRWRTQGSHLLPNGSCCHCGPANHLTGPQYVCDCHTH